MTDLTHCKGLAELAEVVGVAAALELGHRFGGRQHFVPKTPKPEHPWARILGADAWARLCATYGGEKIDLPRGDYLNPKSARIRKLLAEGVTNRRQLAERTGATERYVRQVANAGPSDQMSLPGMEDF
ncbi:MAG: hypothetical protein AB7E47_12910 [Desulfovibrionaceae bacterium]